MAALPWPGPARSDAYRMGWEVGVIATRRVPVPLRDEDFHSKPHGVRVWPISDEPATPPISGTGLEADDVVHDFMGFDPSSSF